MFAVIKTGGKQYRVQEGDVLEIEKILAVAGQKVAFDQVMLIDDGDNTLLGTPFVDNASVRGEVVEEFKDEKVLVFKKKRRKQYRRTRGHRQPLTRVRIEHILTDAAASPLETKVDSLVSPEKHEAAALPVVEKPVIREREKAEKKESKPKAKPTSAKPKKADAAKETKPKMGGTTKKAKEKKSTK